MTYVTGLGGLLVCLVCILLLWLVPRRQVNAIAAPLSTLDHAKAVNEFRRTLAQILGGLFLLGGLYHTSRQLHATEEGQITDRFSQAIHQLGATDDNDSPLIEVRLGGIYLLERVARDSQRDHRPIMEVLTAYVRQHARNVHLIPQRIQGENVQIEPGKEATVDLVLTETKLIRQDIQSALTVIGRRNDQYDNPDWSLNLSKTDLHASDLRRAALNGVMLRYSNLRSVNLTDANLAEANLNYVDLQEADLSGAVLRNASLQHALLELAILQGADLRGVDLRSIPGMTKAQLRGALTDDGTRLPDYLTEMAKPGDR